MARKILMEAVCFLLLTVLRAWSEELMTFDQALKTTFPLYTQTIKKAIVISPQELPYTIVTVQQDSQLLGYAMEDTVTGKWGPIHYFCGLDPAGKILNVSVLDYRERRGRSIAQKRFIKQFVGKTSEDPLKLRKDIQGVTGATISSRAVTDGVKKLLFVFEEFRKP